MVMLVVVGMLVSIMGVLELIGFRPLQYGPGSHDR